MITAFSMLDASGVILGITANEVNIITGELCDDGEYTGVNGQLWCCVVCQDYNDEVTQSQVQELRYLNGEASSPVARGRGSLPMRNSPAVAGDFPGPRGGRGGMLRYVGFVCTSHSLHTYS